MSDDGDRRCGTEFFFAPVKNEFRLFVVPGRINQENIVSESDNSPVRGNGAEVRQGFIGHVPPDSWLQLLDEDVLRQLCFYMFLRHGGGTQRKSQKETESKPHPHHIPRPLSFRVCRENRSHQ